MQTITNKSRYAVAAQTAAGVVVVRPGKSADTKYPVLNTEELEKVKGVKVSAKAEEPAQAPAKEPDGGAQKPPATPTAPSAPKAPSGQTTGS